MEEEELTLTALLLKDHFSFLDHHILGYMYIIFVIKQILNWLRIINLKDITLMVERLKMDLFIYCRIQIVMEENHHIHGIISDKERKIWLFNRFSIIQEVNMKEEISLISLLLTLKILYHVNKTSLVSLHKILGSFTCHKKISIWLLLDISLMPNKQVLEKYLFQEAELFHVLMVLFKEQLTINSQWMSTMES